MYRSTLVVLGAALLAASAAGDEDRPTPLWQAVNDGQISVRARASGSYAGAELVIRNNTRGELRLDVNGAWLKPDRSSEQPLVVGLLKPGDKDTVVTVPAGKQVQVSALTCCMAASLSSPGDHAEYKLLATAATGDAARLAKHWKNTPRVEQGRIQAALWSAAPDPPELPSEALAPPPEPQLPDAIVDLPADTKRATVVGGVVLALRATGDLLRAKPDTRFEKVAANVSDFVADGGVVHAVVAAAEGVKVVRYDVDAARTTDELAPPPSALARGDELAWAGEGVAVVSSEGRLHLVTASGRRALGGAGDRLVPASGGAFVLAAAGDRLLKVSSRGVAAVTLPIVASALAAGPDGVYAIGEKGALFRIGADDRAARVQHLLMGKGDDEGLRAGRCERTCKALAGVPGGLLVETDLDTMLVRPRAQPLHLAPAGRAVVHADGSTGDLYARAGAKLRRYDAEKTAWIEVRFREARSAR